MTADPMTAYAELAERWNASLMPTYGTPPLALSHGSGCTVWDVDGRPYLDLVAGIAVSALGHGHPALVAAVCEQVGRLAHTSNLYLHEPGVRLAERLVALAGGGGRVFFTNSGTEANEAALKLVRRAQPGRTRLVAADKGFHGRTMGALALTGKPVIREPFGPFGLDVTFVPYGHPAALAAAVDERVAAVVLEPTQGEAGVVPPPDGYLAAARAACDRAGALLWLDEVQSGIGRTGAWFASHAAGVRPDLLTLAKGLGGGLPIGACLGFDAAGEAFGKGDHGSTFGGNPVACAAALAVLTTIEQDGLLEHVTQVAASFVAALGDVRHPMLAGVRGRGLWLALVLAGERAGEVERAARQRGFLVNAVAPDAIRLAPPLIITAEECARFAAALPALLDAASGDSPVSEESVTASTR